MAPFLAHLTVSSEHKGNYQSQPFIRNNYDVKGSWGLCSWHWLLDGCFRPFIFWVAMCCIQTAGFVCIGVFVVDVLWAIIAREDHISEGGFVTCLPYSCYLAATPSLVSGFGGGAVHYFRNVLGGVGNNLVNPALFSRLFLTICFPSLLVTGYQMPFVGMPDLHSFAMDLMP